MVSWFVLFILMTMTTLTTITITRKTNPQWLSISQPSVLRTKRTARLATPPIPQHPTTDSTFHTSSINRARSTSMTYPEVINENDRSLQMDTEAEYTNEYGTSFDIVTDNELDMSTRAPRKTRRKSIVSTTLYPELNSIDEWIEYDGQVCPSITARNLYWNATSAGKVAMQDCPKGTSGKAYWRCVTNEEGATWYRGTPDLSECRSLQMISFKNQMDEHDMMLTIMSNLSQMTNNSQNLYGGDLMITTEIMKNMAEKMAQDMKNYQDPNQREVTMMTVLKNVVTTGSNLLNKSQMAPWKDLNNEKRKQVATSLFVGLEENAHLLADTLNYEKTIVQNNENILMQVRVMKSENMSSMIVFLVNTLQGRWATSNDRLELMKESLPKNNSDDDMLRLVFMAFDHLEEFLQPQDEESSIVLSDETQSHTKKNTSRILNSKVISASVGKKRHIQLREPVRIYFEHLITDNVTNPTCVFWNYEMNAWSEEGCYIRKTNGTHTVCECNHLTNFAVLMDVHAVKLDIAHRVALQFITYIGCIISMVCLLLAILTFQLFRGLKSDRTTVHKNLCICLFIAEMLFLCGIAKTEQRIVCGIIAGLLHYFFLCAFAWMFLEGFQLYMMLIKVFKPKRSHRRWYYLIAYGGPLLVVAISCIIDPQSYGTDEYCWLRVDNYFIFSFVGPVILIILINSAFLSMAIYIMSPHTNPTVSINILENSKLNTANSRLPSLIQIKSWLRGAIILVFLLGVTWIFGLLYLNRESIVMAYIFTVLNSLQGLFIFVFHCVQNETVRKEYHIFIRQQSRLPIRLAFLKSMSTSSGSSTAITGQSSSKNDGKNWQSHGKSPNPSDITTNSSGLLPHTISNVVISSNNINKLTTIANSTNYSLNGDSNNVSRRSPIGHIR